MLLDPTSCYLSVKTLWSPEMINNVTVIARKLWQWVAAASGALLWPCAGSELPVCSGQRMCAGQRAVPVLLRLQNHFPVDFSFASGVCVPQASCASSDHSYSCLSLNEWLRLSEMHTYPPRFLKYMEGFTLRCEVTAPKATHPHREHRCSSFYSDEASE